VNGPRPRAQRATSERSASGTASTKTVGQPGRRHDAERIAVAARILHRREPLLAADADADRAPLRLEDRGVRLVELAL